MLRILFLIFCLCAVTAALADGISFTYTNRNLYEPEQKAVIVWDRETKKQTMVLATRVVAERVEDMQQMAWVVPLRSSKKPEVTTATADIFRDFVNLFRYRNRMLLDSAKSAVTVVEMKKLDVYDIAILRVTSAKEMLRWLQQNGFYVPKRTGPLFADYIRRGYRYFVANRIDLRNKFGAHYDLTRALIDEAMKTEQDPIFYDFSIASVAELFGHKKKRDKPNEQHLIKPMVFEVHFHTLAHKICAEMTRGVPYARSTAAQKICQMAKLISQENYEKGLAITKSLHKEAELMFQLLPEMKAHRVLGALHVDKAVKHLSLEDNPRSDEEALQMDLTKEQVKLVEWRYGSLQAFKQKSVSHLSKWRKDGASLRKLVDLSQVVACCKVVKEVANLHLGVATPLRFEFWPPAPTFPLKISSLHKGHTDIQVYLCASAKAKDSSGILRVSRFKYFNHEFRLEVKDKLDLAKTRCVTKFVYSGPAKKLTADAVFKKW